MKSEVKLAVLLVFFVFLIVALLLGEHLSKARTQVQDTSLGVVAPGVSLAGGGTGIGDPAGGSGEVRTFSMGGMSFDAPTQPATELSRVPGRTGDSGSSSGQAFGGGVAPIGQAGNQTGSPMNEPGTRALPVDLIDAGTPGAASSPSGGAGPAAPRHNADDDGKHPVRRGETLSIIAKRYYADAAFARALGNYNRQRLTPQGGIKEGVTLRIPPKEVLLAAGAVPSTGPSASTIPSDATLPPPLPSGEPARAAGTQDDAAAAPSTYTIKSGDTPMAIARKTLGSAQRWRDIMKANPGLDENRLRVGQTIKIPKKPEGRGETRTAGDRSR